MKISELRRYRTLAEELECVEEQLSAKKVYDSVQGNSGAPAFGKVTREDLDGAGEHLQKEYGIELERGFFDYYSILANRQRAKKKISWREEQEAKRALAAFRAWSAENNPGEGKIMNSE